MKTVQEIARLVMSIWCDMHFHPRDEDWITEIVLNHLYESGFRIAVPIYNFRLPIWNAAGIEEQQKRLYKINPGVKIIPSVMLTKDSTPQSMREAVRAGMRAIKFMPDDLSTNAVCGVNWKNWRQKIDCYRAAFDEGCKLNVKVISMNHVEALVYNGNGTATNRLNRESLGLGEFKKGAPALPSDMPKTIEHVSTKEVIDYILSGALPNLYGSLSVRYTMRTIHDVYDEDGNPKPDELCNPIYKLRSDVQAVEDAMVSGDSHFLLGSDKAAHPNKNPKDPPCGVYTGPAELDLVARTFVKRNALDHMHSFVCGNFFKLFGECPSEETITIIRKNWTIPREVGGIKIFEGGKQAQYQVL